MLCAKSAQNVQKIIFERFLNVVTMSKW